MFESCVMAVPISGVLERIESNLSVLTESEAKVARWILDHAQAVLDLTVRDLAQESKSSQAAVIRLCRTLQIDGYSTLKVLITADLVRQERRPMSDYPEINPGATLESHLQSFARACEDSIAGTLNNLSAVELERVSERLRACRRVLVFGVAASHVAANDLAQKLTRLGLSVVHWNDTHVAAMAAALAGPEDCGILISFSGQTREVLDLAHLMRRQGAFIAAITQFTPKNPLAEYADATFYVTASEPSPRIGATTSVIACLVIADALMLCLANQNTARSLEYLKATEKAVQNRRVRAARSRHESLSSGGSS